MTPPSVPMFEWDDAKVASKREAGVFAALMQQAKKRRVPITAAVKSANLSGMSARLMQMGFQNHDGPRPDEQHFVWRPGPN
jgi:hypothetical protein